MVLSVNSISFLFVNDAAFIKNIVSVFKCYNLLLLVSACHIAIIHCVLSDISVSNHILAKVGHSSRLIRLLVFSSLVCVVTLHDFLRHGCIWFCDHHRRGPIFSLHLLEEGE
mgnify:CR=1 FL=1